jgi:hypothetical protein
VTGDWGSTSNAAKAKTGAQPTEDCHALHGHAQGRREDATGTLAPSSKGARAKQGSAKRTWIDGPFAESKELIAGFSILEVPTLQDAIAWADRYATILTDAEVDVRDLRDG